jgi:DNA-binding transcriptional ArsR family regulator
MLWFAMRKIHHPAIDEVALSQVLYALSDPVRLGVVRQLALDGEATCSALVGGRPKSSMSHHFRVLREAGLVRTRTDGPAHMNDLRRQEIDQRFPGLLAVVLAAEQELVAPK